MSTYFHLVARWWTAHPSGQAFIYFLIALFVAVNTDSAKKLLLFPLTYPAKKIIRRSQRDLEITLRILNRIHDNSYYLCLYVAFESVDGIVWSASLAVILTLVTAILAVMVHGHSMLPIPSVYSLFVGGLVGKAVRIRQTLRYLYNYEASVAMLTENLTAITNDPNDRPTAKTD